MQTYLLLFRADYSQIALASPEETQQRNQAWMQWVNSIAGRGLLEGGNHLAGTGTIVKGGDEVVADTVKTEGCSVLGYLLVKASSEAEVIFIAQDCPILAGAGNSVEIRLLQSL